MFARHDIDLPHGRLHFDQAGSGPVLVHLHSGAGVLWTAGLERLTRDFTVVAPVMPGFDGTAALPSVRMPEDLGDLMGFFLAARFAEPVDIAGHSFGGQVAAWAAILHPERVRRLVLAAPAGLRTPDLERPLIRADAAFAPDALFARPDRRRPDPRPPSVQQRDAAALVAYLGGRFFDEVLARRLREIRCATLVLCGGADAVVTDKALRYLQQVIPQATLERLADAGHVLDSDQPDLFAERLRVFLDGPPGVAHAA